MRIQSLLQPTYPLTTAGIAPPVKQNSYQAVSAHAFSTDRLMIQKPVYDPNIDPDLSPRGSFWDRGTTRLGLMVAASATVGGGVGALVARSASYSMGTSIAVGAGIGAVLPVALIMWGMSQWDGS